VSDHLPECIGLQHAHQVPYCVCHALIAVEQRVRKTAYNHRRGLAEGRRYALRDARDAVEAIPAPYKVVGNFETYGPYPEGKSDFKDLAISAIDALRKEQK
jgi:hypothetical protein